MAILNIPVVVTFSFMFQGVRCLASDDTCIPENIEAEGDVIFSAILKLHESEGDGCGAFLPESFEMAAALDWAMKKLNGTMGGSGSFIPGVELGLKIHDDCGFEMKSSNIALDELRKMGFPHLATCAVPDTFGIHAGMSTSESTVEVAGLLRDSNIPFVGVTATAPSLSNKTQYPTFVRTVPSDKEQAKVILDIVRDLNWSYLALVYTDNICGKELAKEIRKLMKQSEVCIALEKTLSIATASQRDEVRDLIDLLLGRLTDTGQYKLGVIFVGRFSHAQLLLRIHQEMARKSRDVRNIFWIMTLSFGSRNELLAGISTPLEAEGLIAVSHRQSVNSEFTEYLRQTLLKHICRENDTNEILSGWIEPYISAKYGHDALKCDSDVLDPQEYKNNFHLPYRFDAAIDAVYILARAANLIHHQLCGEEPGPCYRLRELHDSNSGILKHVRNAELNYKSLNNKFVDGKIVNGMFAPDEWKLSGRTVSIGPNGDLNSSGATYDIYSLNVGTFDWIKVGDNLASNKELVVFRDSPPMKSTCGGVCQSCIIEDNISYSYIPGDVLILATFSLHDKGQKYSCGQFKKRDNSYATFEAFNHAVKGAQKMFPSLNLGALVLDDCSSSLRADYILSQVLSGSHILLDKQSRKPIDVSKIVLVVGARASDITIRIADLATRLALPQISYASSSPDLDNSRLYPYFQRTVPSDTTMMLGMVKMLKKLNLLFVSLIYTKGNFGQNSMEYFVKVASDHDICVADPIEVTASYTTTNQMLRVYEKLRENVAKIVVYFGSKSKALDLLNTLKRLPDDEGSGFVFFTCGTWANDDTILENGRGEYARGSISLQSKPTDRVKLGDSFGAYLCQLNPKSCHQYRWMTQFWQNHFKCNIDNGFENTFDKTCDNSKQLSPGDVVELSEYRDVIHVSNAVIAGTIGVRNALHELCRYTTSLPCPSYFRLVSNVTSYIRNVTLTSTKGKLFKPFKPSGEGNLGYRIYNLQRGRLNRRKFEEIEVGSFIDNVLTVNRKAITFYDRIGYKTNSISSICDFGSILCDRCNGVTITPPLRNDTSRPADTETENGLVRTLGIVILLMFLAAFVVLGICLHRTRRLLQDLKRDLHRSTMMGPQQNTMRDMRGIADGNDLTPDDTLSVDGDLRSQSSIYAHLGSASDLRQLGLVGVGGMEPASGRTVNDRDQSLIPRDLAPREINKGQGENAITARTRVEGVNPGLEHDEDFTNTETHNRVPKHRGHCELANQEMAADQSLQVNKSHRVQGEQEIAHITDHNTQGFGINVTKQIDQPQLAISSNAAHSQNYFQKKFERRELVPSKMTRNQRNCARKDDISSPEGQRQLLTRLRLQAQPLSTENCRITFAETQL